MGYAAYKTIEFTELQCGSCGCWFAMDSHLYKKKSDEKAGFHCPNGCRRVFVGETEEDKLKRQLEHEKKRREWAECEVKAKERKLKRLVNRAKNGVCPCCNRSFVDLARHMKSKHPDIK